MPDDATGPAPDPTPAAATTATAAKPKPKWGDDPETIPQARRDELLALHEAQVQWLAETGPDRDYTQSPFAQATGYPKPRLTSVEVFFLAEPVRDEYDCVTDLHLEGAYLFQAHLERAHLRQAHLEGSDLSVAYLERAVLFQAKLASADLSGARLEGADLSEAHLEGADLSEAHLEGADLSEAHLEGAALREAHLEGADLRGAFFSAATVLTGTSVFDQEKKLGLPRVADVRWQDVNLAVVKAWPERPILGDERAAREVEQAPLTKDRYSDAPLPKDASPADRREAEARHHAAIQDAWRAAARANRQLASAMRDQGMSDEADRFAYQGQVCQRQLYRVQGKRVRRAFSRSLDLLAGYGFKPERTLAAYVLVIAGFAVAYALVTHGVFSLGLGASAIRPLPWYEALVLSVSSFHGRGFFQPVQSLGDPVAILAAGEAIFGLLIEISFIATFTQRFFGK